MPRKPRPSSPDKPIGGGGHRNPASLANLVPGAGAWQPGASPQLRAGLRSVHPPAIVLDPIVREVEAAVAADLPLRNADGTVPGADRFMVELTAIAILRVRRCHAYLALHGDEDVRGNQRPEVDGLGKAVEQAAKMLDRLGCSPRSRGALGLDVAQTARIMDPASLLSAARAEPDVALRRAMLVQGGLVDDDEPEDGGPDGA